MSSLADRALEAVKRERDLRGEITVPEWSRYGDVASALSEAVKDIGASKISLAAGMVDAGLVSDEETGLGVLDLMLAGEVQTPRIDILRYLADQLGRELAELVEPFTVYYRQLTVAESQKISQLAEGSDHKALVYQLIYCLEDAAGNRVFDKSHIEQLMRAPATIIARIAQETSRRPSVAQHVKN